MVGWGWTGLLVAFHVDLGSPIDGRPVPAQPQPCDAFPADPSLCRDAHHPSAG